MMKPIKLLLAIAGGLLVLVVVLLISVVLLFDPNDYRDEIEDTLSNASGRDVALNGKMDLKLFPWLAVTARDVTMSAAPGYGPDPMLSVGEARASVRLLPLLSRRIEIGTVAISDLSLRLDVDADGSTSWDDIVAADDTADTTDTTSGDSSLELSVAGIIVDNAAISYRDAQSGSNYQITDFGMQLDGIDIREPLPVKIGFDVASKPDPLAGRIDLASVLAVERLDGRYRFTLNDLEVEGNLTLPEFKAPQEFRWRTPSLALDQRDGSIALAESTLDLADLRVRLALSGQQSPLALAGTIEVDEFSPRALADQLQAGAPQTTDPDALAKAAFSAALKLTDNSVSASNLALSIDETALNGELSLSDFANPAIRFKLSGSSINLDRYLPPADETVADDAGDNLAENALPVDLIRGLNARGEFRMQSVTLGDLPFTNLTLGLNASGDKLRLNPVSATVLEGQYSGDVSIDASGKTPRLSLNETVSGLNIGRLAALLWERDNIEGTFDGSFRLQGNGTKLSAVRRSLAGDVRFELRDGALTGTDVWYQIRAARAKLRQQPLPPAPSPARTEFSTLRGTAVVKDGVANNKDLFAELPFLQLTGAGNVDLGDSTIDYNLKARVLERPEFVDAANEAELDEYTEAVIPLKLTGPIASPSVRPDLAGLVKAAAKKEIDAEADRLRDELREKEEELKKRLKDKLRL